MATEIFIDYIIQLVDVLSYINEKGIAYRDLKAENIMINGKILLKLVDFGLARENMS